MSSRFFSKLVGAGNDFLFIEGAGHPRAVRPELARRLCNRHFGAGADGLVLVEGSADDLRWDFYNSDGSSAEMCGNAARCFVRWAERKKGLAQISFKTAAGQVHGAVLPPQPGAGAAVEVELPFVDRESRLIELDLGASAGSGGLRMGVRLFNTGVPHAVIEVPSLDQARSWKEVIQRLRWLPEAGDRGANVTLFARPRSHLSKPGEGAPKEIASVTFERGVEDFTLACGTGVIAAALAALDSDGGFEIDVVAPGGRLHVSYGPGASGVRLRGAAELVYEGEFAQEFLP